MIESPCIGICTLIDGYCIGCKRKDDEISEWLFLSEKERHEITVRCLKEMENAISVKKND